MSPPKFGSISLLETFIPRNSKHSAARGRNGWFDIRSITFDREKAMWLDTNIKGYIRVHLHSRIKDGKFGAPAQINMPVYDTAWLGYYLLKMTIPEYKYGDVLIKEIENFLHNTFPESVNDKKDNKTAVT